MFYVPITIIESYHAFKDLHLQRSSFPPSAARPLDPALFFVCVVCGFGKLHNFVMYHGHLESLTTTRSLETCGY